MDTDPETADLAERIDSRVDALLDHYRSALLGALADLDEEEARARLVPSRTTLLGLVKHVTYVERVWFDQAVTGASLKQVGVAATPDASFTLHRTDTVASVSDGYRAAIKAARANTADLDLDAEVRGRGAHRVWELRLQVLRELAQHAGHADILREQVLARRTGSAEPEC